MSGTTEAPEAARWILTGDTVRVPHRGGWTLYAHCVCSRCGRSGKVQARATGGLRKAVTPKCCAGHGHARHNNGAKATPEYSSWLAMKNRCLNPNAQDRKLYSGRGIRICDRWIESFENFLADMSLRPPGTSLDRFPNSDGNYEPGNCRWATAQQQARNTSRNRRYGRPLVELVEESGLPYGTVKRRIYRGWDLTRALTTPVGQAP